MQYALKELAEAWLSNVTGRKSFRARSLYAGNQEPSQIG